MKAIRKDSYTVKPLGAPASSTAHVEPSFDALKALAMAAFEDMLEAARPLLAKPAEPPIIPCSSVGLSARKVRALVRAGRLKATRIGREYYSAPAALRGLLEQRVVQRDVKPVSDPADLDAEAERLVGHVVAGRGKRLVPPSRGRAAGGTR